MTAGNRRYYFAYGSNMDLGQMGERCPGANLVSRGKVERHQFIINHRGVATIVPDPLHVVYGVLWTTTAAHEKSLDGYEGVQWGLYEKAEITVSRDSDEPVTARIYIATSRTVGSPRPGYMEKIVHAAVLHSLPKAYMDALRSWLVKGHADEQKVPI